MYFSTASGPECKLEQGSGKGSRKKSSYNSRVAPDIRYPVGYSVSFAGYPAKKMF